MPGKSFFPHTPLWCTSTSVVLTKGTVSFTAHKVPFPTPENLSWVSRMICLKRSFQYGDHKHTMWQIIIRVNRSCIDYRAHCATVRAVRGRFIWLGLYTHAIFQPHVRDGTCRFPSPSSCDPTLQIPRLSKRVTRGLC
jgi:hypothetical protein